MKFIAAAFHLRTYTMTAMGDMLIQAVILFITFT